MGYNNTTKAIDAPISISTVARVLGTNSMDVGTLCTSPLINKYSVHRPMGIDSPKELTDDEICKNNGGYTNLDDMVCAALYVVKNKYNNGDKLDWETQTPIWYRLTDFIGYKHTTRDFTPIGEMAESSEGKSTLTLTWGADIQNFITKFDIYKSGSTNNVGFGQLGIFLQVGADDIYFVCVSQIEKENKFTTTINLDNILVGTNSGTSGDRPISAKLYAIPVLADYGQGNGVTGVLTDGKAYTGTELNTNGLGVHQHDKAPFKFLALCGTPFTTQYKNYLYKFLENVDVTIGWYGGYSELSDSVVVQACDLMIRSWNTQPIELIVDFYVQTNHGEEMLYTTNKEYVEVKQGKPFQPTSYNTGSWTPGSPGQATIGVRVTYKLYNSATASNSTGMLGITYTRTKTASTSQSGTFVDEVLNWTDKE